MNLKNMTDVGLIEETDSLVNRERELLVEILHYFREIERRRLFSSLGFKSLFDLAVRKFGYSEDQAYRRISAMRLIKDLPEVEQKLNSGELSLTHLGLAHTLFKQEKKLENEMSHDEKLSVLEKISHTSVREAERITLSLSSNPEVAKPDLVKAVSENQIELRFLASAELQVKIESLKGLLAHKYPSMTLGELFKKLCDLGLQEWDPGKSSKRARAKSETEVIIEKRAKDHEKLTIGSCLKDLEKRGEDQEKVAAIQKRCVNAQAKTEDKGRTRGQIANEPTTQTELQAEQQESKRPSSGMQIKISLAEIKREVWRRAQNKCENCGSGYALEIDHIDPQGKGGNNTEENLRLLCRQCNQRAAVKEFGRIKMDPYIN